ncbi:MAG: MATE family efflux transporter [Mariniblastus sp.]|nr:MATE family efflux transporter [Mariniblastus sp.]
MKSFSIVQSKTNMRPMLGLAMPALAEELLVLMVTWTDWWLAGHYFQADGDATKTAMSLMGYFMWFVPSMFAAIAIGATAVVARLVGSGEVASARNTANQAFLIGIFAALLITATVIGFGEHFIHAMQLRGEAAGFAREYMEIVLFSIPFVMCTQVGAACLRGAGDTVTGFVAKSVVVVFNILISTSLVTGWGPFPEIGWKGLAVGTAVGHCVGGLIILSTLMVGRAGLQLRFRWMRANWDLIWKIFRIGLPGGFDIATILLSQMLFLAIINSLGNAQAAAHGLAVQIEACCFLSGAAFQVAAATMAGQFLGAGLPSRATSSVLLCFKMGALLMCAFAVLLFYKGDWFAYFFTGNWEDPTTQLTAELLQIVAVVMPCLAATMIFSGGFRGAGDTIWPLLITAVGFFLIRIPLALYLCLGEISWLEFEGQSVRGLDWGIQGAWYAMAVDIIFRSLLITGRFIQGGWRKVRI